MGTLRVITLTIFLFLVMVAHAFALDEVLRFNVSGTGYCGDFIHRSVDPKNTQLWIRILSDTEMIFSFTPTFETGTTFPLKGSTYLIKKTKAMFAGGVSFENDSYFAIQGKLYFDKSDAVKSMQGIFVDKGVLHPSCFSVGNFWTELYK